MIGLLLIGIILTVLYVLTILRITYGWFHGDYNDKLRRDFPVSVSVVVACRNEEDSILGLLDSLSNQQIPGHIIDYEIVIVDDGSVDKTAEIVSSYKGKWPVRLLAVNYKTTRFSGKKEAIRLGVSNAKGDLIAFTDGDCLPAPQWITLMVNSYLNGYGKNKMILGPVIPLGGKGLLADIQVLEIVVLMGVAAGSARAGMPLLCNGANLLIEKNTWNSVNPYSGNVKYASGDDMFLLEKVKKTYGSKSIVFCNSGPGGFVFTKVPDDLKSLLKQRFRWVSKSPGYTDPGIIFVAAVVYGFHVVLMVSAISSIFLRECFFMTILMFGIKLCTDLPLVFGSLKYFRNKRLLLYYLPIQLAGLFYISIVGIFGILLTTDWKGRRNSL